MKKRHGHSIQAVITYKYDIMYMQLWCLWGGVYGIINDISVLDLRTREWKSVSVKSAFKVNPCAGFASCSYQSDIFIFGGVQETSNGDVVSNTLLRLDTITCQFYKLPINGQDQPMPRMGATLTHVPDYEGGSLILFGGLADQTLNDVYSFNLKNRSWKKLEISGKPPCPRESHSTVLFYNENGNPFLCIYGGYSQHTTETCQEVGDVFYLDLNFKQWIEPQTKNLPIARALHSAIVLNDKMYVHGGWTRADGKLLTSNDCFVLDLKTKEWSSSLKTFEKPRAGHKACMVFNTEYIFGGNFGADAETGMHMCTNELVRLEIESNDPQVTLKKELTGRFNLSWSLPNSATYHVSIWSENVLLEALSTSEAKLKVTFDERKEVRLLNSNSLTLCRETLYTCNISNGYSAPSIFNINNGQIEYIDNADIEMLKPIVIPSLSVTDFLVEFKENIFNISWSLPLHTKIVLQFCVKYVSEEHAAKKRTDEILEGEESLFVDVLSTLETHASVNSAELEKIVDCHRNFLSKKRPSVNTFYAVKFRICVIQNYFNDEWVESNWISIPNAKRSWEEEELEGGETKSNFESIMQGEITPKLEKTKSIGLDLDATDTSVLSSDLPMEISQQLIEVDSLESTQSLELMPSTESNQILQDSQQSNSQAEVQSVNLAESVGLGITQISSDQIESQDLAVEIEEVESSVVTPRKYQPVENIEPKNVFETNNTPKLDRSRKKERQPTVSSGIIPDTDSILNHEQTQRISHDVHSQELPAESQEAQDTPCAIIKDDIATPKMKTELKTFTSSTELKTPTSSRGKRGKTTTTESKEEEKTESKLKDLKYGQYLKIIFTKKKSGKLPPNGESYWARALFYAPPTKKLGVRLFVHYPGWDQKFDEGLSIDNVYDQARVLEILDQGSAPEGETSSYEIFDLENSKTYGLSEEARQSMLRGENCMWDPSMLHSKWRLG